MADLGRRRFLAGTGLAAGLAAGCRARKDPYAPEKPAVPVARSTRPGSETYVLSTCGMCDAGCGIRVRVVDGRAVKVDGNPESPVNRGGLCARGLAAIELLYHPDRVRGPMRRRGGRSEGQWDSISWDNALAELRDRLAKLCAAGQGRGIVLLDGEGQGTTHALWGRFMAALGSPNHVGHGAVGRDAVVETLRAMTGRPLLPGYDFEHAGLLLLVGTGALESSGLAIHLSRALAGRTRPRLVCMSPRLPRTAALVDEWLAVTPGASSALLLGLLHVLLRDQLADESILEKARGFRELRALVMASYSPEQVERLAGVPAARTQSLARELVASRPSVAVVDEETKDRSAVAAAMVLNALLSSLHGEGGMVLDAGEPAGFPAFPKVARSGSEIDVPALDNRPHPECSRILAVPEAILSGKPYPVELLLLYYSNPTFSKPDGKRWAEVIAKVPFVVSFSPIFDESTRAADLILPDLTFFERWDLVTPARGTHVVSIRQPVVAPLANALQTGDAILKLAAALGGTIAEALPWKSHREAAVAMLAAWAGAADDLIDQLDGKGVSSIDRKAEPVEIADVTPAIPETAASVGDARQFPFVLCPFRDRAYAEGGFRQLPWLVELPGAGDPWSGSVEIAPEDARRLEIEDGDWVAVTSPVGRAELRARIHSEIGPGALGLRLGGWGRVMGDVGGAPSRLLAGASDSSGQWLAYATRARIERIR